MRKISMRKIIHIDMDAYFASIEQRDNPSLKGKPVIISGDLDKRSVVSTCSYEARKYGIYSSMPSKIAYKLCPNGIFIKPRIEYYRTVSEEIFSIYHEFTEKVEPLSLDEAFLDVSEKKDDIDKIAIAIKNKIFDKVRLTCSAGASYNKFFAKIASDYNKPNGLMIITPQNYEEIIDGLDIKKIYGIGSKSAERMYKNGIFTSKDIRRLSEKQLNDIMYSRGSIIYKYIRGLDDRPVESNRERKSIGKERTLVYNILKKDLDPYFKELSSIVAEELKKKDIRAKTIMIKIKYSDFSEFTRRITNVFFIQSKEEIMDLVRVIISKNNNQIEEKEIRLIGIYLYNLEKNEKFKQLSFFD